MGHVQTCCLGCKTGVFLCLSIIATSEVFNKLLESLVNTSVFATYASLRTGSTGTIIEWTTVGPSECAPF